MEIEKGLIEFSLGNDEIIYIEVNETEYGSSIEPATRVGSKIYKAAKKLEDALDVIKPISKAFVNKVKDLANSPDEVEIEFGIKVTASVGIVVASSDSDFNFKVKLKWKNE